jgi:hypothetical protein
MLWQTCSIRTYGFLTAPNPVNVAVSNIMSM